MHVYEIVDHLWIGERRRVAKLVVATFCNLAQQATHYLARACLGQMGCDLLVR